MKKSHSSYIYKTTQWGYRYFKQIPDEITGVYIIWYPPKVKFIYVGQAKDQSIQKRLLDHWNGSHNETLVRWIKILAKNLNVCYRPCEYPQIDRLERRLIKTWKPEANIIWNPNNITT